MFSLYITRILRTLRVTTVRLTITASDSTREVIKIYHRAWTAQLMIDIERETNQPLTTSASTRTRAPSSQANRLWRDSMPTEVWEQLTMTTAQEDLQERLCHLLPTSATLISADWRTPEVCPFLKQEEQETSQLL